jgi:ATP-dependent DNA helicase RecQ
MYFGFIELQEILSQWPIGKVPLDKICLDSLLERIRQILLASSDNGVLNKADFQPLIRHLLLRETSESKCKKNLRVPANRFWPSIQEWDAYGISAMSVGSDAFLLTARSWNPTWLDSGNSSVFSDAFLGKEVREDGRCKADPFIADVTGYEFYTSPGQREAIRSAFLIPPGETLIVNLPTGSGKSLVGQAPALVHGQEGYLTLFVVPTVALAIDQERQMNKYFRSFAKNNEIWPLAWYGGASNEDRIEIRRRLREGTQRILFTSPEALTSSLLNTVFEVANLGMLRYFIVDEAHLITQWGDEFRPAFQALAGLRNSLLRNLKEKKITPFRTLLLSATFTPETIDTLGTLFGPPNSVQMIAAVHLRPEPQYWFSEANSFEEKKTFILEALRHAPRPFILYVTKREDAVLWQNILMNIAGYQRIERFDGNTIDSTRKKIISSWIDNDLDGIVATSAFGVGIDKNDIRTIIHATIPETVDRFYQEVGRGGRDGKSSISLLVYEKNDWVLAKNMSNPTIIGNELGFERWKALYKSRHKYDVNGDIFRVDLEAVRLGRSCSNNEDILWNMRTLLLMSRAGFLELDVEPNCVPQEEDAVEFLPLAAMAIIRIHLLRYDHGLPEVWEEVITPSRTKTLNAGDKNIELMQNLLQNGREVADTLEELYRNNSKQWYVDVTKVCGGCPSDRFDNSRINEYHVPVPAPIHQLTPIDISNWELTFPHLHTRSAIAVFYDPQTPILSITALIRWLVSTCGIQEVCASETSQITGLRDWRQLYQHAPGSVVIHRNLRQLSEEPYSPLARVTFFDNNVTSNEVNMVSMLQRTFHLILYPSNTIDPNNSLRLLSDTIMNSTHIQQLILVINQ